MARALFMKDIRLIRKNFAVMAVMIIGMPIFLFWRVDTKMDAGGVPLLLMSSILGLILFGNICTEEEKCPGGEIALLCAPCSRKMLVAVRYLVMSLFFLLCAAGYEAVGLVMSGKILYIWQIMQVFSVYLLLMGIFIPVVYKVGVIKVQYLLSGTVVILGFASSMFASSSLFTSMTEFLRQNQNIAVVGFGVFCIEFTSLSFWISMKIYEKKECI